MLLDFDIEKATAAAAYLIERKGGEENMFVLIKTLYYADRSALIKWGKTITGDSFVSMPKGPVLTEVYNLFKGVGDFEYQAEWDACFSEKVNHSIHLLCPASVDLLSEREMEVLEEARKQVNRFAPWLVSRWLHEVCPEWQDPKGSSMPIEPELILRNAGRTDEEIQLIEESNRTYDQTKRLLGIF